MDSLQVPHRPLRAMGEQVAEALPTVVPDSAALQGNAAAL